jgi:hypothetical protein
LTPWTRAGQICYTASESDTDVKGTPVHHGLPADRPGY